LDSAREIKLQVVEGLTGYIYNAANGNGPVCATKNRKETCYKAVLDNYAETLTDGDFLENGYYHNAIAIINLANGPDFYGVAHASAGDAYPNYLESMIMAFDGFLSSEKEHNVKKWKNNQLPRVTATWSFSKGKANGEYICFPKWGIEDRATECGAGYAFMVAFARAINDPKKYVGYTPVNDIAKPYKERWINTIQFFVNADGLKKQFLDGYAALDLLKGTPVVATEWQAIDE